MDVEESKDSNANADSKLVPNDTLENAKSPEKKSFKPFHGLFFGLFSGMLLSLSNVFIKKAQITTGSEQAFMRYIVQAIIMLTTIVITKNTFFGPRNVRHFLVIRGICGSIGMISLHFSIKLIDPSDSVALLHLNTIITTVLARLFLKELFTLAHLTGLMVSVIGVILIGQPAVIFGKAVSDVGNLEDYVNSTIVSTDIDEISHWNFIGGVSLAMATAFLSAIVAVALKKLSNHKIHYAITTMYASYFGLPVSSLMSLVLIFSGMTHRDPKLYEDVPTFALQILYSFISGLCGTFSQVFFNISMKYEDASKVMIYRSTDLFFTYIFQYFTLNISTNIFSVIGAFLIIFGTVLILMYKIIEKKLDKSNNDQPLQKIFLLKF